MDFPEDKQTYDIDDQFMFGPALMPCPVVEYMYHKPPEHSVLVGTKNFKTGDGQSGLLASYYKDSRYENLGIEKIDSAINVFWYTGRPDYVSDSMFAIRWEGKLLANETGPHQFHLKSFDAKRIILDGDTLQMVYTSTEQYTEHVELEKDKEYDFVLETENTSTGAARMQLFWKTPSIFEREKTVEERAEVREVYLPEGNFWYDFWTGTRYEGGQQITANAPMETMPLYVRAGSLIPMGPFVQYSTEKPADPIELRIYPGADGSFTLYEDENDNYNYEKGIYSTIEFTWSNNEKMLKIGKREGEFPGMPEERTINLILVEPDQGVGINICKTPDKSVIYSGEEMKIEF
jgi:alpha-D-xyloside xylohydrolase